MEFSSAIYRGDPCPEFSFSFKCKNKVMIFLILIHKSIDAGKYEVL